MNDLLHPVTVQSLKACELEYKISVLPASVEKII